MTLYELQSELNTLLYVTYSKISTEMYQDLALRHEKSWYIKKFMDTVDAQNYLAQFQPFETQELCTYYKDQHSAMVKYYGDRLRSYFSYLSEKRVVKNTL